MDYPIKENKDEIISLGKRIATEHPDKFPPQVLQIVQDAFRSWYKQEDILPLLYSAVYHQWIYGTSYQEYFMYDFANRSHDEKKQYVTWYNRFFYMAFLNRERDLHLLDNKFEAYTILKSYYKRDAMLLADENDFPAFCAFIKKHQSIFVKPVNLGLAEGVHHLVADESTVLRETFQSLLKEARELASIMVTREIDHRLILEEEIIPSEAITRFNPFDMSVLRVTTVSIRGKVHFFYPNFKILYGNGQDKSGETYSVDALIDAETGTITTNGVNELKYDMEYHPVTGVKIKGFVMPEWDELKKMLIDAAQKFPTIRYIGWDVVHTDQGWCIIEGNTNGEFYSQMSLGHGVKEEFEELIGFSVPFGVRKGRWQK